MLKKSIYVLYATLAIAFVSCTKGKLYVKETNCKNEIEMQQNLVFTFNEDLVPDSLLNQWTDVAYIKFTPEVAGKFKWTTAHELTFSPATGFLPSTDYQVEILKEVTKYSTKKLSLSGEHTFTCHTPYLTLAGADAYWAKNTNGRIEARLALSFNYKVNSNDLSNVLDIEIDNQKVNYELNKQSTDDRIDIIIPQPVGQNYDKKKTKISIKKGLKPNEGITGTTTPIEYEAQLPDKSDFRILQITNDYEGDSGYITVYTNQTVDRNTFQKNIILYPEINFKTELVDGGFIIRGDFKSAETYQLTIKKTLKGIFGGSLPNDYQQAIAFGDMDPSIRFASKSGLYLTSKGEKNVGIKIINIPEVKVEVYKIYENNLLEFFRRGGYSYYNYSEENSYYDYGYDYSYINYPDYGDLVFSKLYDYKDIQKKEGNSILRLHFDEIAKWKGVYAVVVSSTKDYWVKATKTIAISDIGLIAKEGIDDITVFANSILNTKSLSGVEISLISSNNQDIYQATTNSKGVAEFKNVKKNAPGFSVKMITAKQGNEFSFIHFDQSRTTVSEADIDGIMENQTGYQAFIYGDRNMYRPGETIYLNTIIRDRQWNSAGKIPIKLSVLAPNGKEFTSIKGTLNEEGAFATSFTVPASSVTGTYTVQVYTSNDIYLNSKYISVEEFMPDRIKVNTTLSKVEFKPGEDVTLNATALNLFGPPAPNRNYEVELSLNASYFYPKGLDNYNFNLTKVDRTYTNDLRQGQTDEQGKLNEAFSIPDEYANRGVIEGTIYTTVFDETGRPVIRRNTFDIYTQNVFYGINLNDYYVATNTPIQVPVIAVNKTGKPLLNTPAKIQLINYSWQNVIEKDYNGKLRYRSEKKEVIVEEKLLTLNEKATSYVFTPKISGEYELRIMHPDADAYVSNHFYAYGYGSTSATSFEVDKEGEILIELDKEKYEVGEEATILFKNPFAGKLLVTVERNKIYDYFYIDADKKSATLTLPIKKEYLPNVYISATLIKPITNSAIPLTVANGVAPLFAEEKSHQLPLEIIAPEKSRSNTKQTITVRSKKNSNIEVTLAVVDEGILQIKNYETPDPYGFFFQQQALQVNSYNIYPKLFPEIKMGTSAVGGDESADMGKRINPLTNTRVKLIAFWSGILKTNSNGEASYPISIPTFSGDLRIMAVAYQGSSFGSASKNMKVADPVVVSTALPRFLSPGDIASIPITLTNTTAKSTSANVTIRTEGLLEIEGTKSSSISLAPNKEGVIVFEAKAKQQIGQGKVIVEVDAFGETFSEKIDITIRPSASLQKISGAGEIIANQSGMINLTNTKFMEGSGKAKLIISKSPLIQFTDQFKYLVQYPYGCVEQTTSAAFPQLYFNELAPYSSNNKATNYSEDAMHNVKQAIVKLQGMQMHHGGLSYWPEGGGESWWGTAYAAHFMLEAKKAGYEVSDIILNRMLDYLEQKTKTRDFEEYYYYDETGKYKIKKIAPKEIIYSLYVLSHAGRKMASVMSYYKSHQEYLSLDSKYLLATTYLLLGDHKNYQVILPSSFTGERSINSFGGSFYSYVRDEAIALNALLDTDPNNSQIPIMAKHLSAQLRSKYYYSTQEQAFSLLALGKLAKKSNQSNVSAEIKSNGSKIADFKGDNISLSNKLIGNQITIDTKGTGSLYYFWEMEGITKDGSYKEEDSYLRVRKTFYDRNGNPITTNTFKQNDLIVVKLSVSTTDNSKAENVVVTDMLPAGFEIENPRLSNIPDIKWVTNESTPEYFDVRDDRINFFTTADPYTKNFYYVVRAVSPGTFKMGPVGADAMYNGEYHSYSGSATIRVIK